MLTRQRGPRSAVHLCPPSHIGDSLVVEREFIRAEPPPPRLIPRRFVRAVIPEPDLLRSYRGLVVQAAPIAPASQSPLCVAEMQVYVGGASRGQLFVAGGNVVQVFVASADAMQVGC